MKETELSLIKLKEQDLKIKLSEIHKQIINQELKQFMYDTGIIPIDINIHTKAKKTKKKKRILVLFMTIEGKPGEMKYFNSKEEVATYADKKQYASFLIAKQ